MTKVRRTSINGIIYNKRFDTYIIGSDDPLFLSTQKDSSDDNNLFRRPQNLVWHTRLILWH